MSLNKWFIYILVPIISLLAYSCKNEDNSKEIGTLEEAAIKIKNENHNSFIDLRKHVEEMGQRPVDVEKLQNLESILYLINNPQFPQHKYLQDSLLSRFYDDPPFKYHIEDQLTLLNYYSNKVDSTEISDIPSISEANWKLTLALMEDRIIKYYQPKFGASDFVFSGCCGVNAATNYDNTQVGKPTSIVLQNESPDVEMKFSKVRVMVANQEIEAEVTEMNEIVLVNFTPNKKGDYRVQFMSSVDSYDTTITQNMDISLTDLANR